MHYLSVDEVKELCQTSTYSLKNFVSDQKTLFPYQLENLFDEAERGTIRNQDIQSFFRLNQNKKFTICKEVNQLGNLAEGFPIKIPKFPHFRTAEHLYQCLRLDISKGQEVFEKQLMIIDQTSGEGAKLMGDRKEEMRSFWHPEWLMNDWEMRDLPFNNYQEKHWKAKTEIINCMWFVLLHKLGSNRKEFARVLLKNGAVHQSPIVQVEKNNRNADLFWGAKVEQNATIRGVNMMGKLLGRLRDMYRMELLMKKPELEILKVKAPKSFTLIGAEVGFVDYN
ncbi:DUF1768 domain-containing protein [Flammeovirga yaeyamensis]|uniref:DUF1768 domain-containing protein n=1 Tax=Flammeovirga yaeyamensis TaxID=367791 RepID=A0AAX1N9M2_9BACT|nr:NADAR domain-containing protein [Flammeovirga yaeyamensis]MBB3699325.1 hypothetical protein [Flammeovirga yaeyamensis]NMF35413.1 NADAR family protein [Flammeovirga yaeyamensis]QWG04273.1 DUF1768 domain-containing protein [Flammeovirga yaeyamensis]